MTPACMPFVAHMCGYSMAASLGPYVTVITSPRPGMKLGSVTLTTHKSSCRVVSAPV